MLNKKLAWLLFFIVKIFHSKKLGYTLFKDFVSFSHSPVLFLSTLYLLVGKRIGFLKLSDVTK